MHMNPDKALDNKARDFNIPVKPEKETVIAHEST